jgi:hypothetical protein
MQCDICSNHILSDPGLFCPACARAALYPLRLQYATTVVSRSTYSKRVDQLVAERETSGEVASSTLPAQTVEYASYVSEAQESERRIERIMQQSTLLRQRVEACKQDIAERKAQTTERRVSLDRNYEEYKHYHSTALQPLQKSIKLLTVRFTKQYSSIITARRFLVRQAASLSLLRQNFLQQAEGPPVETYTIGTYPLPDLRDLNHVDCHELNAALGQAVQLVTNVCHYLGLRLPAEVHVPREDWPRPTIYAVASSYIAFPPDHAPNFPWVPKRAAAQPSGGSSSTRILAPLTLAHPRPRPLFVDRPLMRLAKEDSVAYALFIEGVALFAWDVAWLCRTQGMSVAEERWEDVSELGRNLYELLGTRKGRAGKEEEVQMALRGETLVRSGSSGGGNSIPESRAGEALEQSRKSHTPTALGLLSHNTTHQFLRSTLSIPALPTTVITNPHPSTTILTSATDQILSATKSIGTTFPLPSGLPWKFSTATQVIDSIKASLQADQSGLEWEFLDEEGIGPQVEFNLAIKHEQPLTKHETGSKAGVATGTSGWTKLRRHAVQERAEFSSHQH